ncbi:MAG: phage tail tape measure protein [Proteobacteria bacterium]|nr:phage tail tape measure protein [Pseudomonadota bacterium]
MAENNDSATEAGTLSDAMDRLTTRTRDLESGANAFSRAMTGAFTRSIVSGRSFDGVLKSLFLRLSDLSLRQAFQPLTRGLAGGISKLFSGLFGGVGADSGAAGASANVNAPVDVVTGFASGGVINRPGFFPLASGGVGLAGEAGPEAIIPLARGSDGRLGVALNGAATGNIVVNISTPDADSFRRSEVFVSSQIARAVARGQRGL